MSLTKEQIEHVAAILAAGKENVEWSDGKGCVTCDIASNYSINQILLMRIKPEPESICRVDCGMYREDFKTRQEAENIAFKMRGATIKEFVEVL